jgi:hypothetical protein
MFNVLNGGLANSVPHSYEIIHLSIGNALPDFQHALWRQFAFPAIPTVQMPVASLCDHVVGVVFASSKKKMLRIAARWVIAAMKNAKAVTDWTKRQLPCEPMRQDRPAVEMSSAIIPCIPANLPLPTIATSTSIHMAPKSLHRSFISPLSEVSKFGRGNSFRFELDRFHLFKFPKLLRRVK